MKKGRLAVVDSYYAISPAFVKYYGEKKNFPKSLVYANSSYSAENDSLATQFTNNGALAYVKNFSISETFESIS